MTVDGDSGQVLGPEGEPMDAAEKARVLHIEYNPVTDKTKYEVNADVVTAIGLLNVLANDVFTSAVVNLKGIRYSKGISRLRAAVNDLQEAYTALGGK